MPAPRHNFGGYTVGVPSPGKADRPAVEGRCADLDPRVVDRYFGARGRGPDGDSFRALTARTICLQCPIVHGCLVEAIVAPKKPTMIRGAHQPWWIVQLRYRYANERVSAHVIARDALRWMTPLRAWAGPTEMRHGRFGTNRPLLDDAGAE